MAELERLIIDNFKINSGGKTPGAKKADATAMAFSQRATPHRIRFDSSAPLRSIENRLPPENCRHKREGCSSRLDGLGEDKENAFSANGRLDFMDSADLTLLESPITSRQFSMINAQNQTEGKSPSKFAIARNHLKTPERSWNTNVSSNSRSFLRSSSLMDCSSEVPGPSKVPQLSLMAEYEELETLHDLEAAFETPAEGDGCSRYEIISTDSPETGRSCGLAEDMESQFMFGAPLAQTETTKNFNTLSRVPSNTTANRMLNFDGDKENQSQLNRSLSSNSNSSLGLSFANRIKALKDNSNIASGSSIIRSPSAISNLGLSTPRISRCLNFTLERSRSEDSGYSPRHSESSRGSPIIQSNSLRPSVPKFLHSDSMESGCISELSEDVALFEGDSENAFKDSQESTTDILFSMDTSPRFPLSMKNLISAPILTRNRIPEDHMETAEDVWSPQSTDKGLGVDVVDHCSASPLQSFTMLDEEQSLTPGVSSKGRHFLRRCVSLNNPDVHRIRTKLFNSPKESARESPEMPSPFKVPFASKVSRPVKRLDPTPSEQQQSEQTPSQQAKRARMRECLAGTSEEDQFPGLKVPRPILQRSLSDNAANIKIALARSVTEPDLIGDFSRPFSLPLTLGNHSDLKAITAETLARLIQGEYQSTIQDFQVVDCRYPYEFDGGHIHGALNLYQKDQILKELLGSEQTLPTTERRKLLVFHCEFSKERGPNLCRYLRWQDRAMHKEMYPRLTHPEIYLLHGGYRAFHHFYSHLCSGGYTRMLSPTHSDKLRTFRNSTQSTGRKLI